jgi:hypothetical protein
MSRIEELSARHDEIITEMSEIQTMRKGTLNATWRTVTHKDGEVVTKGPYYVLTNKVHGGKTQTRSVPAHEVDRVRDEVGNYRRFRRLADEYVDVCEGMTVPEHSQTRDDAKKN